MALSEQELRDRYAQFSTSERIRKMIEDMVDTHVIMKEVQQYGREKYAAGQRDIHSRLDFPDTTGQ